MRPRMFAAGLLLGCAAPAPSAERLQVRSVEDVQRLSDEELTQALDASRCLVPWPGKSSIEDPGDAVLLEIVRRGGPEWEERLRAAIWKPMLLGADPMLDEDGNVQFHDFADRSILTALRRLQGLRDPLRVAVEGQRPLVATWPELPLLDVRLENVDVEGLPVDVIYGVMYRSGRAEDWSVKFREPGGEPVGVERSWFATLWGGFNGWGGLGPDDVWSPYEDGKPLVLDPCVYAAPPGPGCYELRVTQGEGRMPAVSDWIPMEWRIRTIRRTGEDRRRIEEDIRRLLASDEPPWICPTPYRERFADHDWDHGPAGDLWSEGWRALPQLIDALLEPDRTASERARLLASLTSITGLDDPYGTAGVLGPHVRTVWPSGEGVVGDALRREAQEPLIEAWRAARGAMPVVDEP